jgi:tetratricopeptide (TPR) repeat protein
VRPSDLLAWADASAARGGGYATNGDWRAAFRSYIVAAQLLSQLLSGVEPHRELRDRARRRMDVVVGIAEEIREQHPRLLLNKPSQSTPEAVVASAWAELDETAADARSTLAREENRAGNAQLKAGNNAEAVARYTASLELDATRPHVYGNRSVAFLRMDDLHAAVRDARAAVDLEPEAVARRAGVPLRRGVDGINARRPAATEPAANEEDGNVADGIDSIESSMAEAQRRFSQEVAREVAMLCACSIDSATVKLIECAELGDAEGLLRALGEGAKMDWGNPGWLDYTALHMASLHGHIEIARLLLTAGANVSVVVRSFDSCSSERIVSMQSPLPVDAAHSPIRLQARDGSRPLHLAASPAVAVLLAEQPYADCEAKDRDGLTPEQRLVEEQGWCANWFRSGHTYTPSPELLSDSGFSLHA